MPRFVRAVTRSPGPPGPSMGFMLLAHHGEVAGRDWLRTSRGYVHDTVEAVRKEMMRGATLEDTQRRVTAALALTYEKPFSICRPWRTGLLRNIERTYAMVS